MRFRNAVLLAAMSVAVTVITACAPGQPGVGMGDTLVNPPASQPAPVATTSTATVPSLSFTCQPNVSNVVNGESIASTNGADEITATNTGTVPAEINSWTVTYYDAYGDVIGTDSGQAPGVDDSADALLIQPGQSRSLSADTSVSNLADNLIPPNGTYTGVTCSVTSWGLPS